MATLSTYSKEGKKSGTITVPKSLASAKVSPDLLHQVAVSLQSNLRRSTAHTKTRGEVRGGGKKPWRQKGTGRARHGSTRSPLWRGGGTVFGPRNVRNYYKIIPAAMKKAAFQQVLAEKIRRGNVVVLTTLELKQPKTKLVETFLNKLPVKEGFLLLIVEELSEALVRASRNLPYLALRSVSTVNVLDLLSADTVIVTKKAFEALENRYGQA